MSKDNIIRKNKEMKDKNETLEPSEKKEEENVTNTTEEKPEAQESLGELKKVKDKLSQAENQYLRLLADYQNLQKRTAQEKEDLYKFAAEKTIESLLPALDTFDFAKASFKSETKSEKIFEDFNLIYEMLLKSLKEIGLESIEETGIPFDPFFHEPLQQIPTNELPDQTVMQILKKGYTLNKKVIRPALVSVSIKQEGS